MGIIVSAQPAKVSADLAGMKFGFVEDLSMMESPPMNLQGIQQFSCIVYHMLKALVLDLERQGLVKIAREGDTETTPPRSALDDIDPGG
jgi:hypothetical protein